MVNIEIGGVTLKLSRYLLILLAVNIEIGGVNIKIEWLSSDAISGKH